MKKIITILFAFLSCAAMAQRPLQTLGNKYNTVKALGILASDSGYVNGYYPDTATASRSDIAKYPGSQIRVDNTLYLRDGTATKWIVAGGYGISASNITILNDSSISICSTNSCDTFKFTNIVVNNFSVVNDSTILICDGNNTCDTLYITPTQIAKSYVDSVKVADGAIYYYINGNAYPGGTLPLWVSKAQLDSAANLKLNITDTTGKWLPVGSKFPIGVIKPIIALNDSTLRFDSLKLTELRYSLADRDTIPWTDSTLIDRKYFNDRLASYTPGGGGGGTTEVKQEYTGSSSVTITDSTTWLIINPASIASAITITMPASPTDKQLITISFGGTITGGNGVVSSLTVSPNTGQSIIQSSTPSYVQSGESISYRYNISNTSYYRIN